jgi:fructose-1,6-bisphosphatase/inositol monophosphatase family enzyme
MPSASSPRGCGTASPGAVVVGEEAHSEDESVLDGLEGAELAFVIDPVDGTFNFAAGLPLFGVMLAVVVNGETVAGMIYDPVGVDMLMAVKGGGAVIRHAERATLRCQVAPAAPIPEMTGSVSWQYADPADKVKLARNLAKFKAPFGYRCAAHEYRLLATGFGHFDLFMKVMPWDHLPGTLILQEAGGHVALTDGTPYRPGHVGGGLLCAPDKASWEEIRATLWSD